MAGITYCFVLLNRYVNHHPDPDMWNCHYVTNEDFFNSETGMCLHFTCSLRLYTLLRLMHREQAGIPIFN